MMQAGSDKDIDTISRLLADLYSVEAVYRHQDRLLFSLTSHFDRERSEKIIRDRLNVSGYRYDLDVKPDGPVVLSIDPKRRFRIPTINLVLFILTLFSVYVVPVFLRRLPEVMLTLLPANPSESISMWQEIRLTGAAFWPAIEMTLRDLQAGAGIVFTIAIISILFVHEMGHFIASRRRGIVTSLPYFIPAPNLIGTFGAVIKSKSPFWNRRDLIEVGAAGPIAGWIVALGWLVYGLSISTIQPATAFSAGDLGFSLTGESILIHWLTPALVGTAPQGYFYFFSEAAFAGWVGLLVTAINLLPIGQLDGGHIVYGLQPFRQKTLGWLAMAALLVLGMQSPVWWVFAVFGLIFGVSHPPTLDDAHPPGKIAEALGIISLVILALSFTPMPFE
jgi:membrane-associated protease RseP (regulator of RpoE activity)